MKTIPTVYISGSPSASTNHCLPKLHM